MCGPSLIGRGNQLSFAGSMVVNGAVGKKLLWRLEAGVIGLLGLANPPVSPESLSLKVVPICSPLSSLFSQLLYSIIGMISPSSALSRLNQISGWMLGASGTSTFRSLPITTSQD